MPLFVLLQDPSTTAEKQHSLNHPVHFSLTFRLQNFFFKMARIILTGAPRAHRHMHVDESKARWRLVAVDKLLFNFKSSGWGGLANA